MEIGSRDEVNICTQNNSVAVSPQAIYTDCTAAICRRSQCQLLRL
jgi:hypothetical protein